MSLETVENEKVLGKYLSTISGILTLGGIKTFILTINVFHVLNFMEEVIIAVLKVIKSNSVQSEFK